MPGLGSFRGSAMTTAASVEIKMGLEKPDRSRRRKAALGAANAYAWETGNGDRLVSRMHARDERTMRIPSK